MTDSYQSVIWCNVERSLCACTMHCAVLSCLFWCCTFLCFLHGACFDVFLLFLPCLASRVEAQALQNHQASIALRHNPSVVPLTQARVHPNPHQPTPMALCQSSRGCPMNRLASSLSRRSVSYLESHLSSFSLLMYVLEEHEFVSHRDENISFNAAYCVEENI